MAHLRTNFDSGAFGLPGMYIIRLDTEAVKIIAMTEQPLSKVECADIRAEAERLAGISAFCTARNC